MHGLAAVRLAERRSCIVLGLRAWTAARRASPPSQRRPTRIAADSRNARAHVQDSIRAVRRKQKRAVPITRYLLSNDRGMTRLDNRLRGDGHRIEVSGPRRENGQRRCWDFPRMDGYLGKDPLRLHLSAGMPTASPRASSSSTARSTRWRSTTRPTTMHGGLKSFSDAVWSARPEYASVGRKVGRSRFDVRKPRRRRGLSGHREDDGRLHAEQCQRAADRLPGRLRQAPTIINLTSHIYWNLHGAGRATSSIRSLTLNADKFLPGR